MRVVIGMRNPAGQLPRMLLDASEEGEHRHRIGSPGCSSSFEKSMVRPSIRGGVPVFSRPCGSFSSLQPCRQRHRGRVACAARLCSCSRPTWIFPSRNVPAVSTTARDGNAGQSGSRAPTTPVAFEDQIVDRLLKKAKIRLVFEAMADRRLVQNAVGLGARRPNGRALATS